MLFLVSLREDAALAILVSVATTFVAEGDKLATITAEAKDVAVLTPKKAFQPCACTMGNRSRIRSCRTVARSGLRRRKISKDQRRKVRNLSRREECAIAVVPFCKPVSRHKQSRLHRRAPCSWVSRTMAPCMKVPHRMASHSCSS